MTTSDWESESEEATLLIFRLGAPPDVVRVPFCLVMDVLAELAVSGCHTRVIVEWNGENARKWDTGGYITHYYSQIGQTEN